MIEEQQLESIAGMIAAQPLSESLVSDLRRRFPEIHFTYCLDDDVVAAEPALENSRFNLYLVDSRDHCLTFTQDREAASGIVVAEIESDS
ncbi:MAG: DUF6129 family protein [Gammaproteobacteria bacterium]